MARVVGLLRKAEGDRLGHGDQAFLSDGTRKLYLRRKSRRRISFCILFFHRGADAWAQSGRKIMG
jgi:hypothetical protein